MVQITGEEIKKIGEFLSPIMKDMKEYQNNKGRELSNDEMDVFISGWIKGHDSNKVVCKAKR